MCLSRNVSTKYSEQCKSVLFTPQLFQVGATECNIKLFGATDTRGINECKLASKTKKHLQVLLNSIYLQ